MKEQPYRQWLLFAYIAAERSRQSEYLAGNPVLCNPLLKKGPAYGKLFKI